MAAVSSVLPSPCAPKSLTELPNVDAVVATVPASGGSLRSLQPPAKHPKTSPVTTGCARPGVAMRDVTSFERGARSREVQPGFMVANVTRFAARDRGHRLGLQHRGDVP